MLSDCTDFELCTFYIIFLSLFLYLSLFVFAVDIHADGIGYVGARAVQQ